MFNDLSWFEVMYGQGIRPQSYDPLVDRMPKEEIIKRMQGIRSVIEKSVDYMPTHAEFIAANCRAEKGM
jgi:tryptophan 7-halogenase